MVNILGTTDNNELDVLANDVPVLAYLPGDEEDDEARLRRQERLRRKQSRGRNLDLEPDEELDPDVSQRTKKASKKKISARPIDWVDDEELLEDTRPARSRKTRRKQRDDVWTEDWDEWA